MNQEQCSAVKDLISRNLPVSDVIVNKIFEENSDYFTGWYETTYSLPNYINSHNIKLTEQSVKQMMKNNLLARSIYRINLSRDIVASLYKELPFPDVFSQEELTNAEIDYLLATKVNYNTEIKIKGDLTGRLLTKHIDYFQSLDLISDDTALNKLDYNTLILSDSFRDMFTIDFILSHYKTQKISFDTLSWLELPISFISERPSRFNWKIMCQRHSIDEDFYELFKERFKWENIGYNNFAIIRNQCDFKKINKPYDKNYLQKHYQKLSMEFIKIHFEKLFPEYAFASLFINSLNGECDFEKEIELRESDFFNMKKYVLNLFLNSCFFSETFLKKHYKDFTRHQLKKEVNNVLEQLASGKNISNSYDFKKI